MIFRATLGGLLALLVTTSAAAQDDDARVGVGMGLQQLSVFIDEDIGILNLLTPQVYVPVRVGDRLLIEPGLGFLRSSSEFSNAGFEVSSTFSLVRLGVGVLFLMSQTDRGAVYAGPRVGFSRLSEETSFDGEDQTMTRTDLALAAVIGGEFFLVPRFSLGGEAGLQYVSMGDEEREPDPDDGESDGNFLSLGTELRVRWYLR